MKKFISLFLVMSMIVCNLNTGVVEALSSYGNEVKSLVNTLTNTNEEKKVDAKEGKGLEQETTQVKENTELKNNENVDSKTKDEKVDKSSDKKSSIYAQDNIKEKIILVYYITTRKFYFSIDSGNEYQEIPWMNENTIKSKKNLNKLLEYYNSNNKKSIEDEVTFLITGTGNDIYFDFDNDYECPDVPFNFIFYNLNGENCNFSIRNVKSINIVGKNTISNSENYDVALTYSFNSDDLNPLNIAPKGSFTVYNKDKDIINNNIVYEGNIGMNYENSGGSSIVNVSFEEEESYKGKNFILVPDTNNNDNNMQKEFSTRDGYKSISILLVSDNQNYTIREKESNQISYYYRTTNDPVDNYGRVQGAIKTKITLKKDTISSCYDLSNKSRVEVISKEQYSSNYYLVDNLKIAIENSTYFNTSDIEFVFLGNYYITEDDITSIKNCSINTSKITFKTKVDDYVYTLNIDKDIELMINNNISVYFDDIKFNYSSDKNWIYANGSHLIFGKNVEMHGNNYPSISLDGKLKNSNSINNSYLIINSGTYGTVIGEHYGTSKNINVTINGGTFNKEVTIVKRKVENDVTLTISNDNNPIFRSKVLVTNTGSNIGGSLNVSIKGGVFDKEFIAVNGNVAKNVKLTINNGTFSSSVLGVGNGGSIEGSLDILVDGGMFRSLFVGVSLDTITTSEKYTLNSLLNRYLFDRDLKLTNDKLKRESSSTSVVNNINITIKNGNFRDDVIGTDVSNSNLVMTVSGGTFRKNLIGNKVTSELINDNTIINIDGTVKIPTIMDFTSLVVGKSKRANLTVDNLYNGHSMGSLYLDKNSKITFTQNSKTSEINNIVLLSSNNTIALQSSSREKDNVLINLSGKFENKGNKLNIQVINNNTKSKIYLMKFITLEDADVENKYVTPNGYYVRDQKEEDLSGYVVLYPQTDFYLEYNLNESKLYMINNEDINKKENVWWYNKNLSNKDVILDTRELYKYKGYNLLPNDKDRNLVLTGTSSDKNITVENNLNNFNIGLNKINLNNSSIKLNKLKYLILNGENTINSINANKDIFTYTFNADNVVDRVKFKDNNSYLKVFTNGNVNPFNGIEGNRIDLKFYKEFNEEIKTVRLSNDINTYSFEIPDGTQRIGLLLKDKGNYNLYHGTSDNTGTSVYVSGNDDDSFTNIFSTSSDNSNKVYEYVRRAKPINKVAVDMPSEIDFGVTVRDDKLNSITTSNWEDYFYATKLEFKNSSTIIADEFIEDDGTVHHFSKYKGNTNDDVDADVKLEYMGVNSSWDVSEGIELISSDKLKNDIIRDDIFGVKLALKIDDTEIDESIGTGKSLDSWIIKDNEEKMLSISPNFGKYNNFFNISKNLSDEFVLNSRHKLTFRYGLKN